MDSSKNTMESRMIWFDGEMTGLEIEYQHLVEVACIITESDLTIVATYGPTVIWQPKNVLDKMSDWCKKTFKKNGLLWKIKNSKVTEKQAEKEMLEFLQKHTPFFTCPLVGNSVDIDRLFIEKYLPAVGKHLHSQTIDVSTLNGIVKRWYPGMLKRMPRKKLNHRSLDDVMESIIELKYYRDHLFITF